MQMIDVLKRLAELDSANPNVIREGSIQQGVWTANAPKPGQPDIAPPMPDEGPTANQPFTIDQAKRHPSYRTDPKFKAEVDKAERFANGLGKKWDQNKPAPTNPGFKSIRGNVPSPDDMATSPPPRRESAGIREGRSDYTTDEMVAMLTKQKTQQQVDAEAERTRGPDKGQAQQPNNSTSQRPTPTTTMKESLDLAECGMMPMPGMGGQTHTPASISMTANSGPELSGMLADIMKLAGVHQVEPAHLGIEHEPAVLTAEPSIDLDHDHSNGEIMRSVMDKMNPEMGDEEETDEGMWDNSPADPEPPAPFDANEFAHRENQPGQGDRMDGDKPKAYPTMEEQLMADWKQFMTEGVAEGRVDQLPTRGADYSKYDTDHLKALLRPGILHRNEARFKALIRKELKKREQQDQQGVAEGSLTEMDKSSPQPGRDGKVSHKTYGSRDNYKLGDPERMAKQVSAEKAKKDALDILKKQGVAEGDGGAKYRVKSVGNDVNPATDERCDYYINPVTDKKVYCKPGQKVSKGDHVNPTTGKVTPKV